MNKAQIFSDFELNNIHNLVKEIMEDIQLLIPSRASGTNDLDFEEAIVLNIRLLATKVKPLDSTPKTG